MSLSFLLLFFYFAKKTYPFMKRKDKIAIFSFSFCVCLKWKGGHGHGEEHKIGKRFSIEADKRN